VSGTGEERGDLAGLRPVDLIEVEKLMDWCSTRNRSFTTCR